MVQRRSNSGGGKRQKGQVMPMTAILIVAVLLSLWAMYDSGQLMTERMKLQNTADNVAYSGSALVARDLNYTAYTNRAMVANQVAVGQLVGLSSWATMGKQMAMNLRLVAQITAILPPLYAAVNSLTTVLYNAANSASRAIDNVARVAILANNSLVSALSKSQSIFHVGMSTALTPFSENILAANDPEAYQILPEEFSSGQAFLNWAVQVGRYNKPGLSKLESTTNQRFEEFSNIVRESRDPFTARRSYEMGFPFSGGNWMGSWSTQKRGGSDFTRKTRANGTYQWEWSAMDTVGFDISLKTFLGDCIVCANIPLGWGAAHALEGQGNYYNYQPGSGWGDAWDNYTSANYARIGYSLNKVARSSGLQAFNAFEDDGEPNTYGPALVYLLRKDNESMYLTADLGAEGDNPLNTEAGNGFITAAAKAQPYYSRPTDIEQFARLDGNFEYGNLYNPFWQPRLIKLNTAERVLLAGVAGLTD